MRRFFVFALSTLLMQLIAVAAFAQQAPPTQPAPADAPAKGLEGRWKGSMQIASAGDMEVTATFKKDKEKDVYTGGIIVAGAPGERPFKSVKVDGDQVQAQAEFETPNGNVVVSYNFTLKDDSLKGKGEADLGGQKIPFDIDLKRAAEK